MIKAGGTTTTRCPVCTRPGMKAFFEVEAAPVFCNVLWSTRQESLEAPMAPIRLGYCPGCELVRNLEFDPDLMEYDVGYENSLHCSPHFQQYAVKLADELIQRYDLRNKDIIEIGCGQGEFLELICERGNNRGVGFDPSFREPRRGRPSGNVSIIRSHFTGAKARRPVDLVCCRHVLEHIARPLEMLLDLRRSIKDRAIVVFEVPNGLWTFEKFGVWDIIYEHCSYFVPGSLRRLFERAGFEVLRSTTRYDGQFLTIEARIASESRRPEQETDVENDTSSQPAIDAFAGAYQRMVRRWSRDLESLSRRGERIALWGGGSKGVTFLNVMRAGYDAIPIVVDVNPKKHGRFVAGTGQEVIGPDELRDYRPSSIIVMNPVYRDEICQKLTELGLTAQLLDAHNTSDSTPQSSGVERSSAPFH